MMMTEREGSGSTNISALSLAKLSKIVYYNDEAIQKQKLKAEFKHNDMQLQLEDKFENKFIDSQAALYRINSEEKEEYVLAFRGTDSFRDVMLDVLSLRAPLTGGGCLIKSNEIYYAHAGIYIQFLSLFPRILFILLHRSIKKLYITGHSLGGGLAVLCAIFLENILNPSFGMEIVTFGAPKVVSVALLMKFKEMSGSNISFYCNRGDPIPYFSLKFKSLPKATIMLNRVGCGIINHSISTYISNLED